MEKQRIKLEVYQGLPIVQEMIKDLAITKEMGECHTWIGQRQFKRISRNFQFSFTAGDVVKLNSAIWRIGQRLESTRIEFNDDRQLVIDQIKEKLSEIRLPYIYKNKMGKMDYWWNDKMKKSESKGRKSRFKTEDVLNINLAVAEIAARLLSIELVAEQAE